MTVDRASTVNSFGLRDKPDIQKNCYPFIM